MNDFHALPDNLPKPIDDGACSHLVGLSFPAAWVESTSGISVNLSALAGTVVLYFYPMTGIPGSAPMVGWNDIPGARGCTPQSLCFRDSHAALVALGATVFGVSAQPLTAQKEAQTRLKLPFDLLNDSAFALTNALKLPTFDYAGTRLIKRLTLIVIDGVIAKVFYPVFPPDENATAVMAWLES
jgi:peroxiredoxin